MNHPKMGWQFNRFDSPKHKEATYAQCSRLYAASLPIPENEILIISDIDMALFNLPAYFGGFSIYGSDLVPNSQYPMCYITADVATWITVIGAEKSYQEHLDSLLGHIEADHFRGNYWGKDQETAFKLINPSNAKVEIGRARPGTQFATNRIDRDDAYWEERLNFGVLDAHLWRPGYTEENF